MNRRGFLAAAVSATVAPKELVKLATPLAPALTPTIAGGLGVAAAAVTERCSNSLLTPAQFTKMLQESLNEVFSKAYASEEWKDLFDGASEEVDDEDEQSAIFSRLDRQSNGDS